jgi:hypothetical protein
VCIANSMLCFWSLFDKIVYLYLQVLIIVLHSTLVVMHHPCRLALMLLPHASIIDLCHLLSLYILLLHNHNHTVQVRVILSALLVV